uniref:Uncharacterized protein n=1 Tax=Quercus lobata TaxID=97700 RepID=A0A7N2MKG4_QUELO
MCQTKDVRMSIGATLGEVEKVDDANENGFCLGNFLRIWVLIDISMALCRGRKVEQAVVPRVDVVNVDAVPNHVLFKIPNFLQHSNFEWQIWEIDAAINGDISVLNFESHKEGISVREENTQVQDDATLERYESVHVVGPHTEA